LRIILPEEREQLKAILRFLDENYYTGILTNKKYLSKNKQTYNLENF
jgi:hypothetical protein